MRQYPALKILLLVVSGYFLGLVSSLGVYLFAFSIIALAISLGLALKKFNASSYFVAIIASGIILSQFSPIDKNFGTKKVCPEFKGIILGKVSDILGKKEDKIRLLISGELDAEPLRRIDCNVILSLNHYDNNAKPIRIGDKILTSAKISIPQNFTLETDFPEIGYAKAMNADFIARSAAKQALVSPTGNILDKSRDYFLSNIQNYLAYNTDTSAYPYLLALIAGDRSKISSENKREFTLSGAAHVLSIGGLHIGIISAGIFVFLFFVKNKWVKFILFSILTVAFAYYTGASAPALRAAYMAIFYILVKTLYRRSSTLNIIAASALIMIIIDPSNIGSLSFLLSVGSVLGIIAFYPFIFKFINKIIKNDKFGLHLIKQSLAVSLSAGIIISPCAYIFKSYSLISPIANFIVIPAFNLGMIWAFFGAMCNPFSSFLGEIFGSAASAAINLGAAFNSYCAKLPFSAIRGEIAFFVALAVNIGIIYVIYSKSKRQALYRLSVSIIGGFLLISISSHREIAELRIIPRKQCAAIETRKNDSTIIILADRKPRQYYLEDKSLIDYCEQSRQKIRLTYIGSAATRAVETIAEKKEISKLAMNFDFIRKVKNILQRDKYLVQEIDL